MGKVFSFVRYKSAPQQGGAIDFDELMEIAKATRPEIGAVRLFFVSA